jgi:3-dehydroquinate synthase
MVARSRSVAAGLKALRPNGERKSHGSNASLFQPSCLNVIRCHVILFHYTRNLTRILVQTPSRSYEVLIERGLLGSTGAALRDLISPGARVFALSAPPIRKHYGNLLRKSFAKSDHKFELFTMPDGETSKTLAELQKLAVKMVRYGADRTSVLLALGGGVVGDVGAFLASIFMRGIPVVQIPTTLLAQVDSSVGGKTGVNLKSGKNLLGTFHQPLAVLADPDVLKTLPEREYRSGLFEAMKYGVIRNPAIFELMESNSNALLRRDGAILETLITECIRVKAEVVSVDERENGERRILNFGHTIGHALEAETNYRRLLHGEAVGWGMIAASMIGASMQITDSQTAQRIYALVLAYGPLPKVPVDSRSVMKRLLSDKKTVRGIPHFVLPTAIGKVEVVNNVPARTAIQAIKEIRYLSKA